MTIQHEVYIDDVSFKIKPTTDDVKLINNRITKHKFKGTAQQIADYVGNQGCTFLPSIMNGGRAKSNFVKQSVFAIDFDNDAYQLDEQGQKVKDSNGKFIKVRATGANYASIETIKNHDFIKDNASFIYKTFSNTDDWERFRVVFTLNRPLENQQEVYQLGKYLSNVFPMIDTSTLEPTRLFYGGTQAIEVDFSNVVEVDDILVDEPETTPQATAMSIADDFDDDVKQYIALDGENLLEESNWVSVVYSLLNSIHTGELSVEQAEKYCVWIAQNNAEWAVRNVDRLRYELRKNTRPSMSWTFANKVYAVIKPKRLAYQYDDTGNAERFIEMFGDDLLFNTTNNSWYFYNGKVWQLDDTKQAYKCATKTAQAIADEPNNADDKEKARHVKYTRSHMGKRNLLNDASSLVAVSDSNFDDVGNLLNLQNGYYDLDQDMFLPHDKSKVFTLISRAVYDETADCPTWLKFINETFLGDVEMIDYIQRLVGYALSNSTVEKQLFILWGEPDTGKSVFLNVLHELLGGYSMSINPQSLMASKNSGADNASPAIAKIRKARLVTTSEISDDNNNRKLDASLVKRVTGNDPVTARFLHQNEITYIPEYKIFMATNYRPISNTDDSAMWQRLVIVPFQNKVERLDFELQGKIVKELSGVLNWALEGYRKYKQHGLKQNEPAIIQEQRTAYRQELDVIGQFVDDCCEFDPQHREKSAHLYRAYSYWANENGQIIETQTKFSREIGKRFEKIKSSGIQHFVGVRLKA